MTFQIKDTVIYKGKRHGINSPGFDLNNDNWSNKFPFVSTACWRGYVAQWEVRSDLLFLTGIKGTAYGNVGAEYLFSSQKEVFAEWFSGDIKFPDGKYLGDIGYASVYERDIVLKFKYGKLIKEYTIENKYENMWGEDYEL
ncbi:MAG: hypothetical protein ACTHMD_01190 [Flavisolibacter sp.]